MSNVTILKQLDFERLSVALRSDGLAWVKIRNDDEVDVEQVKQIVGALRELGEGKKFPMLVTSSKHTVPTAEARAYVASAGSNPYASAEAYVLQSFSQKLVGNVYMKLNKPVRPTWMFTSETKAVEWLKTFL